MEVQKCSAELDQLYLKHNQTDPKWAHHKMIHTFWLIYCERGQQLDHRYRLFYIKNSQQLSCQRKLSWANLFSEWTPGSTPEVGWEIPDSHGDDQIQSPDEAPPSSSDKILKASTQLLKTTEHRVVPTVPHSHLTSTTFSIHGGTWRLRKTISLWQQEALWTPSDHAGITWVSRFYTNLWSPCSWCAHCH